MSSNIRSWVDSLLIAMMIMGGVGALIVKNFPALGWIITSAIWFHRARKAERKLIQHLEEHTASLRSLTEDIKKRRP